MFILILLIIATLLGLIAAAVVGFGGDERRPGSAVGVLALTAVIWLACSVTTVSANTQDVRTGFGKPTGVIGSGLHLVAPWSSGTSFSSATQWVRFVGDGNGGEDSSDEPKIRVRLAAQSTADVEGSVTYNQPADKVMDLFTTFKTEERIRQLLVLSNTQQALNEVLGTYDPLALAKADADVLAKYSRAAEEALRKRIGDKVSGITVNLTMIDLDDNTEQRLRDIQSAIAKTRVAEQDALTAAQIALANRTIAESLKGDAVTAYYRCVEMVTAALREIKPQTVDLQAVCATAVGVLR